MMDRHFSWSGPSMLLVQHWCCPALGLRGLRVA